MTIQILNGYSAQSLPSPAPATRESAAPVADAVVKAPAPPVQQKQAPPSQQQVEQALDKVKQVMTAKASALTFTVDDKSGDTIVRVVDSDTGEVIRQIPSKELVEIARALDKMQGMLLKQSA